MTTFATRTETVEAWGGRFNRRFQVAGSGPALVYLHGARGMYWGVEPVLTDTNAEECTTDTPLR